VDQRRSREKRAIGADATERGEGSISSHDGFAATEEPTPAMLDREVAG
jgi:hypothetical protein